MERAQVRQFESAMRRFLKRLGPGYTETRVPDQPHIGFLLQEKAPPGQKWENGERFRKVGAITFRQAEIIATTSHHEQEMYQRIEQLLLHDNDTTRYDKPQGTAAEGARYTDEDVKKIVTRALIEAQKQREGTLPERPAEEVAEDAMGPAQPADDAPTGIRAKKRKSSKEYAADREKTYELWKERAKMMGWPEDPPRNRRTKHVDGHWLRRAKRAWAARSNPEPAEA